MVYTLKEFLELLEPEKSFRLFRYTKEDYKEKNCYQQVVLAKKDGGKRFLQVPNRKIKQLQYDMLPYFQHAEISVSAAAYRKGRTLLDHAILHSDRRILVKLDIENFFGSITFSKVYHAVDDALKRSPRIGPSRKEKKRIGVAECYNSELSWFITNVCTLNGTLPQGAPTSPILSNMVFSPLDQKIIAHCNKHHIIYTRYSDDMAFSGDFDPGELIRWIRILLRKNGYRLNEEKTMISGKGQQKKITGIVVNQRPQADRRYRKTIRQEIYYIGRYGIEEHMRRKGISPDETGHAAIAVRELQRLIGKIAFVLQIDPANKEFIQYKEQCTRLLNKVPILWP